MKIDVGWELPSAPTLHLLLLTRVCCWQGKALSGLGDEVGAEEAYQRAVSQQLLYPKPEEVEEVLKRLKGKRRKGSRA